MRGTGHLSHLEHRLVLCMLPLVHQVNDVDEEVKLGGAGDGQFEVPQLKCIALELLRGEIPRNLHVASGTTADVNGCARASSISFLRPVAVLCLPG
jgi:hypothetical protein